MRRALILALMTAVLVVLPGSLMVARADDDGKSDFSLFDGTNPSGGPTQGALCGGGKFDAVKKGRAFTFHVTLSNHSSGGAGQVVLKYYDGDVVFLPIAPCEKFHFSQAAGGKGGADRAVRIFAAPPSGAGGPRLSGAMSALGPKVVFCVSCDSIVTGGVGDAACDGVIAD